MRRLWGLAASILCAAIGLYIVVAGIVAHGRLERADQFASVLGVPLAIVGIVLTVVFGVREMRASQAAKTQPVEPLPLPVGPNVVPMADDVERDIDRLRRALTVAYDRLFGVSAFVAEVGELLGNHAGSRIVSIWGDAGTGKTTMAFEIARQHATEAGFARVFGISVKFTHIGPLGVLEPTASRTQLEWRDLLVELAKQIAPAADINTANVEHLLPGLLPAVPCLIVIDNLETVPEGKVAVEYLIKRFAAGPHRFLLTTRESVAAAGGGRVNERRWHGPSEADAKDYARYLAQLGTRLNPSETDLDDVVRAAECTPLLIQIIVRYAAEKALTIREVLQRLRDIGGPLGRNLWQYCYSQSMDALAEGVGSEKVAARLMAVFCFVPAGRAVADGEFYAQSRIEDRELFLRAREIACRLTLVRALDGNKRFTVHSLLREHFCSGPGRRAAG
ncbi:hypothetical protein ACQP1P_35665 [Dactylosporangium sp. CA-052675]|uniref:hypothetical protein n=1 Tax=Dactylosporangium sp. CA-052675 TaxID=3239927 RepID=UPI003D8E9650